MVRRLVAIMFTDIAGFTALSQEDEEAGLRLLKHQDALVRPLLVAHHGRKVKSIGDGLLIEFPNARDAVQFAVELQRRVHELNASMPEHPLPLRVGIHLGDVQRKGADILGDAVNIASRIEPLAPPGGICLSELVYLEARNQLALQFEKLGEKTLKGVREPVEVYRVVLPWVAAPPPQEPATAGPPRLAVLPFSNISPDPVDEYFADGLTEELISALSQIRDLRVISRTSVAQYRGTTKPVRQIGTELGVGSVLEGSVRKVADRLRITVQLIDARSDEHLWSKSFDRHLEDVFEVQREVAEQTASALRIRLSGWSQDRLVSPPTTDLHAYSLYLQGIHAFRSPSQVEVLRAISLFDDATHADPTFSLAYSYLANALIAAGGELIPWDEAEPRARRAAVKALGLAPASSEAHVARGNLAYQAEHDWALAEAEFQSAITLNPSSSAAHTWYGILLSTLQRFGEGTDHLQSAVGLDPEVDWIYFHLVTACVNMGDLAAALDAARRCAERCPRSTYSSIALAVAHLALGDPAKAERELDAGVRTATEARLPGPVASEVRFWHAVVCSRMGNLDETRELLAEWSSAPSTRPLRTSFRAAALAIAGRAGEAFDLLEAELRNGNSSLPHDYHQLYYDVIRGDPRFVSLLRTLNLPTSPPRGAVPSSIEGPPNSAR